MSTFIGTTSKDCGDDPYDARMTPHPCLTTLTSKVRARGNGLIVSLNMIRTFGTGYRKFYKEVLMEVGYQHHMGKNGMPTLSQWLNDDIVLFDIEKVDNAVFNSLISESRALNELPQLVDETFKLLDLGYSIRQAYGLLATPKFEQLDNLTQSKINSRFGGHFTVSTSSSYNNIYSIGRAFNATNSGYKDHYGAWDLFKGRKDKRLKKIYDTQIDDYTHPNFLELRYKILEKLK